MGGRGPFLRSMRARSSVRQGACEPQQRAPPLEPVRRGIRHSRADARIAWLSFQAGMVRDFPEQGGPSGPSIPVHLAFLLLWCIMRMRSRFAVAPKVWQERTAVYRSLQISL
jgi:hypothetical protein